MICKNGMKTISIFIIANDNEDQQWYNYLPIYGKNIVMANFNNASELLKDSKVDLILLDCGFKIKNGLSLLMNIKKIRRDLPVIFITENGSKELVINVFRAQARYYFEKPVNVLELTETINNLIRIKNTSKERRSSFSLGIKKLDISKVNITSNMPINILRTVYFIETNLPNNIKLDMLAKVACLSKYHFCRSFIRYISLSPMKFVNLRRIDRAKVLLKTNNLSISRIANLVGYKNCGKFIRHFKFITGVTPVQYKNSILDN